MDIEVASAVRGKVAEETAPRTTAELTLWWSRRDIVRLFTAVAVVLFALSAAGQVAKHSFGHPNVFGLVPFFYVDLESSLPAWYQSVMLLFCAVALAGIAVAERRSAMPFAGHWAGLAAIFLFLSIDEMASIHERLMEPLARVIGYPTGIWAPTWVFAGIGLVVIVGLIYLRFLLHFRWWERLQLALAGGMFVGGAVGLEMATAGLFSSAAAGADVSPDARFIPGWKETVSFAVMTHVEEAMEMTGILVFVDFLLRRLTRAPPFRIAAVNH